MDMNRNLLYVHVIIVLSLFLSVMYLTSNSIPLANASPGSQNNITQIPSEATDFPGNNQQAIEILFTKASKSDNGDYHVKGSIKNIGENTLGAVKVTAQFFDENNKTIGITTCCNASPSDMEPGHTSSFDSFASINDMVGIPKYYKMSFDWKEEKSVRNELENNGNNESLDTITIPPTASADTIENILNGALPTNDDSNNNGNGNGNENSPASTNTGTQPNQATASRDGSSPTSIGLSCGQVVRETVTLSADLDCETDGIIVGSNGITIDLNGYTIKGPGPASSMVGVMLANNAGVHVLGPGTISNFQAGILNVGGKDNAITRITLTDNEIGIFNVESKNTSIKENKMDSNEMGFSSKSSSGTVMKTNILLSNALSGVTLVESNGNEISDNEIKGSVNGIFIDEQSSTNTVIQNTVGESTEYDLNNGDGLPINDNHNAFTDNNCSTSVPDGLCGEK